MDAETASIEGLKKNKKKQKKGDNKLTGKIVKVMVDVKPTGLTAADQKAVADAEEDVAAAVE